MPRMDNRHRLSERAARQPRLGLQTATAQKARKTRVLHGIGFHFKASRLTFLDAGGYVLDTSH